jgi:hypothetical protein
MNFITLYNKFYTFTLIHLIKIIVYFDLFYIVFIIKMQIFKNLPNYYK